MMGREELGRIVRSAWVAWTSETWAMPEHHLASWEALPEHDREVYRHIGEAVATRVIGEMVSGMCGALGGLGEVRELLGGTAKSLGAVLSTDPDRPHREPTYRYDNGRYFCHGCGYEFLSAPGAHACPVKEAQ